MLPQRFFLSHHQNCISDSVSLQTSKAAGPSLVRYSLANSRVSYINVTCRSRFTNDIFFLWRCERNSSSFSRHMPPLVGGQISVDDDAWVNYEYSEKNLHCVVTFTFTSNSWGFFPLWGNCGPLVQERDRKSSYPWIRQRHTKPTTPLMFK